jgi:hypothetical protein
MLMLAAGDGAAAGLSVAGILSSIQTVAQAAAAVCLLAVAVPPLISTEAGTRLLCTAASRVLPGG